MSALDERQAERVARYWEGIKAKILSRSYEDLREMRDIIEAFKEAGLDLGSDATYALLEAGLTKQDFDAHHTYLAMLWVIDSYHTGMHLKHDYIDVQASTRAYALEQILKYRMPYYEDCLAKADIAEDAPASPATLRDFAYIRELYQDGTLEQEMKHASLEAAKDRMRNVFSTMKQVENNGKEGLLYRLCKEGLSYAENAIEAMDKAGELYKPGTIPAEYGRYSGWGETTMEFSREKAEEFKTKFLLMQLKSEFNTAVKFQEEGHFVLDVSGGGYGMNQMPVQEIAGKLAEYGYDLTDPATFEKIGTDQQSFRERYQRERQEVIKNKDFSKLVKPEFKL